METLDPSEVLLFILSDTSLKEQLKQMPDSSLFIKIITMKRDKIGDEEWQRRVNNLAAICKILPEKFGTTPEEFYRCIVANIDKCHTEISDYLQQPAVVQLPSEASTQSGETTQDYQTSWTFSISDIICGLLIYLLSSLGLWEHVSIP
jgi:hypothetical protein